MAPRFGTDLLLLLAGATLAALALVLDPAATGWIALGTGCLAVVTALAGFATSGRGAPQRVIDVCMVLLGGWTIVASRTFGGATVKWLSFGGGAGLVALGAVGLIAHEALMERALRRRPAAVSGDGRPARMPERRALDVVH